MRLMSPNTHSTFTLLKEMVLFTPVMCQILLCVQHWVSCEIEFFRFFVSRYATYHPTGREGIVQRHLLSGFQRIRQIGERTSVPPKYAPPNICTNCTNWLVPRSFHVWARGRLCICLCQVHVPVALLLYFRTAVPSKALAFVYRHIEQICSI